MFVLHTQTWKQMIPIQEFAKIPNRICFLYVCKVHAPHSNPMHLHIFKQSFSLSTFLPKLSHPNCCCYHDIKRFLRIYQGTPPSILLLLLGVSTEPRRSGLSYQPDNQKYPLLGQPTSRQGYNNIVHHYTSYIIHTQKRICTKYINKYVCKYKHIRHYVCKDTTGQPQLTGCWSILSFIHTCIVLFWRLYVFPWGYCHYKYLPNNNNNDNICIVSFMFVMRTYIIGSEEDCFYLLLCPFARPL